MTAMTETIRSMAQSAPEPADPDNQVRFWLHAEGAAAFIAGTLLYFQAGGDGLLFLPALLLPDVGLLGYLRGARLGAMTYDLIHNWAVGLAVLGAGIALGSSPLWLAGAILIAHVGMDRAVGYGLKYRAGAKVTHLQRV
jgi:Domain of unknown function (DUF4260)